MAELIYSADDYFEKYFLEIDYTRRMERLHGASEEIKADPRYAKIKEIADRRYTCGKNGQLIDRYMVAWVNSQIEVEHMGTFFMKKGKVKRVKEYLAPLNLPEDGSKIDQLEYMELCNLVRLYINLCQEDKNYNSVIAGLGDRGEKSLRTHILADLKKLEVMVPDILDLKDVMAPLSQAIAQVREEVFHE